MFSIKAIQAGYGDCLLVTWAREAGEPRHILIDGGPTATHPTLVEVLADHRVNGGMRLEALVITHYDLDHIQGAIELLSSPPEWLEIKDVWFNGRQHVIGADVLGAAEADALAELIENRFPWNTAFGGKAVVRKPASVTMLDGLTVQVLSPDRQSLAKLATGWPPRRKETKKAADGLGRYDTWPPGDFLEIASEEYQRDSSAANRSSMALMLEFDGKRVLFAGDAHPDVIADGLNLQYPSIPAVALLKVSHHGSKGNTDERLLKAIDCNRFLISTNGTRYFHPDTVLIARILKCHRGAELIFNYRVERTLWWEERPAGWPPFRTKYPCDGHSYVMIDL